MIQLDQLNIDQLDNIDHPIPPMLIVFIIIFATVFAIIFSITQTLIRDGQIREHITKVTVHYITAFVVREEIIGPITNLVKYFSSTDASKANIEPAKVKNGIISIPFIINDSQYNLLMPYDGKSARRRHKTIAVKNGEEKDLNHHPGIQFILTPEQLDVDDIRTFIPTVEF